MLGEQPESAMHSSVTANLDTLRLPSRGDKPARLSLRGAQPLPRQCSGQALRLDSGQARFDPSTRLGTGWAQGRPFGPAQGGLRNLFKIPSKSRGVAPPETA